jgi:hypothetical protein
MDPIKIIVNDFVSKYTASPNPIRAFTYPYDIPLRVTYNGSENAPAETGNYDIVISALNGGDIANTVTGIYSIVGRLKSQSYALGWGRSNTLNANGPNYGYAPTGLVGVEKIACGQDFCVALMSNNSIITWGSGNLYGQQYIPYINNYIKDIEVSDNTTFILDWSGNVTGCGYMFNTRENGYSGSRPYLTGISSLSASNYYVVAIPQDRNSHLTGWADESGVIFNYKQKFNLNNISQICCTDLACIALRSGVAIAWGLDHFGQLAWLSGQNSGNIKKISCSDTSTVFLYNNNTIAGFGQCVNANNEFADYSIPDPSIQGHVLDVSVSNTQTLLILDQKIAPPVVPVLPPVCTGIVYA